MRSVRAGCAGLLLLSAVVLWPGRPGAQSGRAMTVDDLIGAVRIAVFFILALIAVLASIPWPGRVYARPLFRV